MTGAVISNRALIYAVYFWKNSYATMYDTGLFKKYKYLFVLLCVASIQFLYII